MGEFFGVIFVLALMFLPTIIAVNRHHQSTLGIFFLNLLLGWTVIGWFCALFWALGRAIPFVAQQNVVVHVNQVPEQPFQQIIPVNEGANETLTPEQVHEKMVALTSMKEKGWISDEEFEAKRVAMLAKMN